MNVRSARAGRILCAVIVVMAVGFGELATAFGADVETEQIRNYKIPDGFAIAKADVQTNAQGETFLAATSSGEPPQCEVVRATADTVERIQYSFEDRPTGCVRVLPIENGTVFIRAQYVKQDDSKMGATVRVSPGGESAWAVEDSELANAESESNGGPGEFFGSYGQPAGPMAYSAELEKFIGFSVGFVSVGQSEKPVTQAHILDPETGRLLVNGQRFGSRLGEVGGVTTRQSDGHFFLYTYDNAKQGAHFFVYDGRQQIDAFEPRQEDWTSRFVTDIATTAEGAVYILWSNSNANNAVTRITRVDETGQEQWTREWPGTTDSGTPLGPPRRMWVAEKRIAVLYSGSESVSFRFIDSADSRRQRLVTGSDFIPGTPLALGRTASGKIKLVSVRQNEGKIYEYRLEVALQRDTPDATADGADLSADASAADTSTDSSATGGQNDGCGCSAKPGTDPKRFPTLAFGVFLLGSALCRWDFRT